MDRFVRGGVALGALLLALGSAPASAAPDDEPDDRPPALIQVPAGCPEVERADVAFVGTVLAKDFRTVRYEIDQLRAGSAGPWAIDGLIDVRYGTDAQYLDVGEQYLVGAAVDPELGVLASAIKPPEPLFGGNDVIGLEDTAVECPEVERGSITLHVDGTTVDSGVFTPLLDDRRTLFATIAVPTAVALAALLVLVVLRFVWKWAMTGVFALGRAAVTPTPDHRAVRTRHHGDRRATSRSRRPRVKTPVG